ncbi:MAG TPA: O-antigen ligase family protein [Blastocatellia bacterium]|nr:O-antigen ligase family protein [Blastocatellia bacterium]
MPINDGAVNKLGQWGMRVAVPFKFFPFAGSRRKVKPVGERTARFWALTTTILLLGYLCCGRSFAYVGIPPLNVFIGEVALGLFILTRAKESLGKWCHSLMSETRISTLAWAYYIFAGYGVIQAFHGLIAGYPPLITLQGLVFNIYPLYFFLGLWVGSRYPERLEKFFRWLAWCNGIYGTLFVGIVSPYLLERADPGRHESEVSIFGSPCGSALAIIGLLCFERRIRPVVIPMILNSFVMLGMQVRAEWLGFAGAFALWGVLSRKIGRMLAGVAGIILLLAVGYVADFSIPSPAGRGGQLSTKDIIGRGLSAIDSESASEYSETTESTAGTVEWRKKWWRAIWSAIHENNFNILFGFGHGYPLTDLVPYLEGQSEIRSPHNIFFFCLSYTGWVGVILFFTFQLVILRLHWLVFRQTRNPFGVAYVVMSIASAFFSNCFETPFGAIPYYLLTGLAIAPLLRSKNQPTTSIGA